MNNIIYTVVIVTTILLSSCAQMQQRDEDRGKNLTRFSYGPLNHKRPTTFVQNCDKSFQKTNSSEETRELAQKIVTAIITSSPMKGIPDTIGIYGDENLNKEDLEHFFKIPRGSMWPYARLLYRDYDSIDFWFDGVFLNLDEADTAASAYCSHWKKTAVFYGYIEHCGIIRWTPFVDAKTNQRITQTDSDVIVAYNCVYPNKSLK